MPSMYKLVRKYAKRINNGRTLTDIHDHSLKESIELSVEIQNRKQGRPEGADGVVGEAIDGIACLYDIILVAEPNISNKRLKKIMKKKLKKWVKHYANSIEKANLDG